MADPELDESNPITIPAGTYFKDHEEADENFNPFKASSKLGHSPPKQDPVDPFKTKFKLRRSSSDDAGAVGLGDPLLEDLNPLVPNDQTEIASGTLQDAESIDLNPPDEFFDCASDSQPELISLTTPDSQPELVSLTTPHLLPELISLTTPEKTLPEVDICKNSEFSFHPEETNKVSTEDGRTKSSKEDKNLANDDLGKDSEFSFHPEEIHRVCAEDFGTRGNKGEISCEADSHKKSTKKKPASKVKAKKAKSKSKTPVNFPESIDEQNIQIKSSTFNQNNERQPHESERENKMQPLEHRNDDLTENLHDVDKVPENVGKEFALLSEGLPKVATVNSADKQNKKEGDSMLSFGGLKCSTSSEKDAVVQFVPILKYSQTDWNKLKQEMELEFQTNLLIKEREFSKKLADCDQKIAALDEETKNLWQINSDMRTVVAEFEKTMEQLQAENEKSTNASQQSLQDIINERDQAVEDLQSVETAFSDLHRRYEKTKGMVEGFKRNEEVLKKCAQEHQAVARKAESKTQEIKAQAEEKLEKANEEVEKIRKSNALEITRLEAAMRKAELTIQTLERSLEVKVKENQELTCICDELIAKVGQ